MKKMNSFILLLCLFVFAKCCNIPNKDSVYNTYETTMIDSNFNALLSFSENGNELLINKDSIMNFIANNGSLWLNSWKTDLSTCNFEYSKSGVLLGANDWNSMELIPDFFDLYQNMLIYSADNFMCVDLYSYKIGLEKKDSITWGYIDADTKIFLLDLINKKSKLLITCGTTKQYDDCIWISNECFILLGSESEFTSESELFRPFIMIYDISHNFFLQYNYKQFIIN